MLRHEARIQKGVGEEFVDFCRRACGIVGIKGHRSVGGFRASLYNALPIESVRALVEAMNEFQSSLINHAMYESSRCNRKTFAAVAVEDTQSDGRSGL